MIASKRFWFSFAAIAAPFLLWLGYQFIILGVTYWDGTANYNFEYWLYSSMGWDLANWAELLYKWPSFMYDAAFGFRTHFPAIPETQLAAVYGAIFGWPGDNLADFARLGIWLNIIVVCVASAWGAVIANSLKISPLPLFAVAALAASNPAYSITWPIYPHLLPLYIPVGLAIFALGQVHGVSGNPSRVIFLALGYLLSMHYAAMQPIVALGAAILVSLWAVDGGPIYKIYSEKQTGFGKRIIIVGILSVIFFGFILVIALFSDRVLRFVGAAELSVVVIVMIALAVSAIILGATYLAVKRLNLSKIISFLFATVGDGAIGLALGANLLLFMSWQRGFLGAFAQSKSNEFGFNYGELANFIFLSGSWNWMIPILLLGAIYIGVVALIGKHNTTGQDRFIGTFSLVLMVLVLLQAMPELADAAAAAKGSILDFYAPRLVIGAAVVAPVILIWFFKYNRHLGNILSVAALAVVLFSARDYYNFATKNIDREGAVAAYVKETVGSYMSRNSNAHIICVNDRMAGLCNAEYVWFHYRIAHNAISNNDRLPEQTPGVQIQFLFSKKRNCEKLETCLDVSKIRDHPILVAGREDNIPGIIKAAGKPISGSLPAPSGIFLVEIPGTQ